MVISFNSSASVLFSSRMLDESRMRFAGAVTRASSGLRLYTAAKEAAGTFLASSMQARIAGWQRAQANIQDGLSAGNIADGALAEMGGMVNRIRELAIQAANGIYSANERTAMQAEATHLSTEIDRLVQTTTFNTLKLLQGERDPAAVADLGVASLTAGPTSPVGTGNTQTGVYAVDVIAPGQVAELVGTRPAVAALPSDIQIDLTVGGVLVASATFGPTGSDGDDALDIRDWVNANGGGAITAAVDNSVYGGPDNFFVLRTNGIGTGTSAGITVTQLGAFDPEDYIGIAPGLTSATGTDPVIEVGGVQATVTSTPTALTVTVNAPGEDPDGISFTLNNAAIAAIYKAPAGGGVAGSLSATQSLIVNPLPIDIQAGPNEPAANRIALEIDPMNVGAISLADPTTPARLGTIDLTTAAGARAALDVLDAALLQVNQARGTLGAGLQRLDAAQSQAVSEAQQTTLARSRITDTDIAFDATVLAQEQIRTDTAAAAQAHLQARTVDTLRLVADTEMAIPTGLERGVASGSGSPAGFATGSGAPTSFITGSGAPTGFATGSGAPSAFATGSGAPTEFATGSGAPIGFATGSGDFASTPLPGSGGFSPVPVLSGTFTPTPVTPGFEPLPVIGSRDPADITRLLSSASMMSLLAGAAS